MYRIINDVTAVYLNIYTKKHSDQLLTCIHCMQWPVEKDESSYTLFMQLSVHSA